MAVTLFYFSICIDLQYFVCEWNALLVNRFIAPINLCNLSKGNAKNQNALKQNEEIETVPCAFFIADSQSSIHYSQHFHQLLHEVMKSFHLTRTHTQANMVSLVVLILWPDFFFALHYRSDKKVCIANAYHESRAHKHQACLLACNIDAGFFRAL